MRVTLVNAMPVKSLQRGMENVLKFPVLKSMDIVTSGEKIVKNIKYICP